jgi:hypothetical protein
MGQAKVKEREGFSLRHIEEWEADDCVNFAVALARLTGWLLHVDWWSPRSDDVSEAEMKPLRVYVADNREGIFDVRGVKTLVDFSSSTIIKLAKKRGSGFGGVLTRYYSEAKLSGLPLRCAPDESKIALAVEAIKANPAYLDAVPAKPQSRIPVHDAARYTFGRCVAYAEALREWTGLRPVAILGKRFAPLYERAQRRSADGYVHSIVMHPDGMGEDAWGIASIEDIAGRFGAIEFEISVEVHQEVVANYHRTSRDTYEAELKVARQLIAQYR